ncbi:MAG TPA: serine/threonine-protein kinase [Vicinamibacteria bacterium]
MAARDATPTFTEAETLPGPPGAAASAATGPHPLVLGPYEVRELVGEGAMGRVYRARDPRSGRDVAVKRIKARFSRERTVMTRFLREAEAVSRLSHPGLVAVHGAGEDYIAMELVLGESLEAWLARRPVLPPAEALAILEAVASALDYIHGHGIVHRDVKPSNLLLLPGGGVKITDFGIARLSWAPMTRSGEVLGTPAYMAPEQVTVGEAGPATDVYALGVVAFEMLTGRRPFRARSYAELMMKVIDVPPPSAHFQNRALDPEVDEVLAKVLSKRPEDRFESAAAFASALRRVLLPGDTPVRRAARRLADGVRSLVARGASLKRSTARQGSPSRRFSTSTTTA